MPKTRKIQFSFSGGEIDPQMYGRIDMQQYQSGLATCKNWMVDPRGSLRRRPGMERVAGSSNDSYKSRLIPFTYSVDQQLAVELTNQKLRFHTNGQTLVWAQFKEFHWQDGVNTSENTITFNDLHGFEEGEQVVFYAQNEQFSALPLPFRNRPDGEYYVRVVDSKTIQLFDSATGGSVVSITSLGVLGYSLYVFSRGSLNNEVYTPTSQARRYVGPARIYRGWSRSSSASALTYWRGLTSGSNYCLDFSGGQNPTTLTFFQGEKVQLVTENPTNPAVGIPLPGIPTPLYVDYFGGSSIPCGSYQFGLRTKKEYVGTEAGSSPNTFVSRAILHSAMGLAGTLNGIANPKVWIRQYHEEGDLIYMDPDTVDGTANMFPIQNNVAFRVTSDFGSAWAGLGQPSFFLDQVVPNISKLDSDGAFSVASPYLDSEIFDVEYDQSGDVVTATHPNHRPHDLVRIGAVEWKFSPVSFQPTLDPPSSLTSTVNRGAAFQITSFATVATGLSYSVDDVTTFTVNYGDTEIPFAAGDTVYISVGQAAVASGLTLSGYYVIAEIIATAGVTRAANFTLRNLTTGILIRAAGTSSSGNLNGWTAYYSTASAETVEKYKVAAVDERGQEGFSSEAIELTDNVLSVAGSSNTVTWPAIPLAKSYNVYKLINGVYGFIGQVDSDVEEVSYSFVDDNIGPDLSQTLLIPDTEVEESYQPRASARFEQRRCFGGADSLPRTLFMSRSGTESSFSYRLPTQADDRISVNIASREAHVIRHIVPVQDLVLMSQQGEFRVTAINSDAITPDTIAIRQQSYIGSNNVHPQVVNNTIVFCSARGGHAREMNFRAENQSYLTGDLSIRAGHLFDGFELTDMTYSKAPIPVLWFVSSSGKMLCLTYLPEEQILSWHQHETEGVVESVCSVSEGNFDNLYVVVKRGSERSIERIVQVSGNQTEDAVYLDASVKHNGTNTGNYRLSITSLGLYQTGESVTVKSYDTDELTLKKGLFSQLDENSIVEFSSGDKKYRVLLQTYVSETEFTGKLLADFPDLLKDNPTSDWAFGRKTFSGFSHLANQSIQVVVDENKQETVTVSATGTITLSDYAIKVCGGLPFTSTAKTLPLSLDIEAGSQARTKSINQVFIRVKDSGSLKVGADGAELKSVTELTDAVLSSGEFRTSVPSTWNPEGDLIVEASGAFPATLLNITAHVSIGD